MAAIAQIVNQAIAPATPTKGMAAAGDKSDTPQDFLQQLIAAIGGDPAATGQLVPLNGKATDLLQKVKDLAAAKDGGDVALSDSDVAKLAALFQQFPALQQVLDGRLAPADVAQAIDALAQGKALPDALSAKFDPAVLKDLQNFVAAQNPAQIAGLKSLLDKMTVTDDQSQLVAIGDKIKQLLDNKPAARVETAPDKKPVADKTSVAETAAPVATPKVVSAEVPAVHASKDYHAPGKLQEAQAAANDEQAAVVDVDKVLNVGTAKGVEQPAIAVAAVTQSDAGTLLNDGNKTLSLTQAQLASQTLQTNNLPILNDKIDAYALQQAKANQAAVTHPASMMVSIQMQKMAQSGQNQTMLIQLQPQELGRIEVRLRFEGGRVKAHIAADKAETLELMQKDGDALASALQGAGLEANGDALSFSLRDGGQSPQQNNFKSASNNDAFGTMLATSNPDTVTRTFAMMPNGNAADGRVDVKI